MFALLLEGGLLMIPIGICSVLAVGFTIERFIYLYSNHTSAREFWERVEGPLKKGRVDVALARTREFKGVLAELVEKALQVEPLTAEAAEEEMKIFGNEILLRLKQFLPSLDFIAQVSPLLGLLGTVAGMIETFRIIAEIGVGDPNLLAGGIYTALVTTAAGLTVGIVALFFHYLLKSKVDSIINDLEAAVNKTTVLIEENDV